MPADPEAGAAGMLVAPVLGIESVAGGMTGVPAESVRATDVAGAAVWTDCSLPALHPTAIAAAISSIDVAALSCVQTPVPPQRCDASRGTQVHVL